MKSLAPLAQRTAGPNPIRATGARSWWMVGFLTLAMTLSFVDRNILRILVEPIRHDLGLSDVQISLLAGLAFAALYSVSCIPFGYAADRMNRRSLLALAVTGWSAMSLTCGAAGSYAVLFAGRLGLGVGEAALQPCAMSMIGDAFPPERRARAIGVLMTGPLIGSALALVVGGALYGAAASGAFTAVPVLGALRAWQVALVLPGLAGLLLAVLAATVREPARRTAEAAAGGYAAVFRHWRRLGRTHALLVGMSAAWALGNTGWLSWTAAAISRVHGLSVASIGATAGLISLAFAATGSVALSFVLDARAARGDRDAALKVTALVQLVHLVPAVGMFYVSSVPAMWVCFAAANLLIGTTPILGFALLTEITPARLVGKSVAIYNLVQNLVGYALGPTLFAFVGERVSQGPTGIVSAIAICYPATIVTSSILAFCLLGSLRVARQALTDHHLHGVEAVVAGRHPIVPAPASGMDVEGVSPRAGR